MTIAHHHKTYKIPHEKEILLALVIAGLTVGGVLGWKKIQQAQEEKIQQAQIQLTDVCQTNIDSNDGAIEASNKVSDSTTLLQSVPRIPGLGYQTAQEQLTFFAPCIQNLQATEDFFAAEQLSQEAINTTGNSIYPVSEWRTLQSNLEQAIALLKGIPEDAAIQTEAQQDLQSYQTKLEDIHYRLMYEAEADHAFAMAEQLKQAADQNLANSSNSAALMDGEAQLEEAIRWLETIPQGHVVSAQAQSSLAAYQQQLVDLRYQQAASQLKIFVDDFYKFTTSLDTTLTYHTYSEQLNQFNDRFYALIEDAPNIVNHPAVQSLQVALNQSNDAMSIWRYCHEGNCYTSWSANILDWREDVLWIPAGFWIGDSSLDQAYPVPTRNNIWMEPFVQQNVALSTIWKSVKQDVAAARNEMNGHEN